MSVQVLGYTAIVTSASYARVRPTSATPPAENTWYSVTVRASAAGMLLSGPDMSVGSGGVPPHQAFELLPDKDYVFNAEFQFAQDTLYLYNNSGSDITVTALLAPLR